MTDLHIYAKHEGLRDTEWERDGETYGWGNNRALVLMTSSDLIHWSRTNLRLDLAFAGLEDVGCVWAPQTTYDPVAKKLMLYFTMRIKNGVNRVYYSYVNEPFTQLETQPKLLFEYPNNKVPYIDADIIKVEDKFHLFYVSHENGAGIKQAVSDSINRGYVYDPKYYDPEAVGCEAPNVWKRIGEEKWVLMYDVYRARPNNMGFSETSDFKNFTDLGHLNKGVMTSTNFKSPKHAAIIHLTKQEADDLTNYWKNDRTKFIVQEDARKLTIAPGYCKNLRWNLPLDTIGGYGAKVVWTSDNPEYLTDEGVLMKRSALNGEKVKVTMTVEISLGDVSEVKRFEIFVAHEVPKYDGYLFAYFEGSGPLKIQEQLRFGVSADAVNWTALNGNNPVIASAKISKSGGIRDPHILRGEDEQTFYIVATDMFTRKFGWGENPGIVLLKSNDLIHWNHAYVDFAAEYPDKFGDVQWVWAPQTIYDPSADKYLVYFTIRYKDEDTLDFYCAYANTNFTGFENEPEFMFRAKYGAIDGDIVYQDGVYHLFFKGNTKDENGHEFENGIKQAVATSLQGPWVEHFEFLDAYKNVKTGVEGSSIFKLNNSDTFVLMYDLYSSGRYEFQYSTDLYHFTEKPASFTKNFHPRHGSVIGVTKAEAKRLNAVWKGVPEALCAKE